MRFDCAGEGNNWEPRLGSCYIKMHAVLKEMFAYKQNHSESKQLIIFLV